MMEPQSTYNDLPWELIMSALQGGMSPEEERAFQEWLALSEGNRREYERVQRLWREGMGAYPLYRQADEDAGWAELQRMMSEERTKEAPEPEKAGKVRVLSMKWLAAAAVILILGGAGWWYGVRQRGGPAYVTAAHEMKQVALPDGSVVGLDEQTQLRVEAGFNTTDRKLALARGRARFDVQHDAGRPFEVEAGEVSIKDIGTSFTIERTEDSIRVQVWEGKAAFIRLETGESGEITAGSEQSFSIARHEFGKVRVLSGQLKFDDQPLSVVIAGLERTWSRRIVLNDPVLARKRLTVHLDGEAFEDAIKTVCISLNLEYHRVGNDAYVLESRK